MHAKNRRAQNISSPSTTSPLYMLWFPNDVVGDGAAKQCVQSTCKLHKNSSSMLSAYLFNLQPGGTILALQTLANMHLYETALLTWS